MHRTTAASTATITRARPHVSSPEHAPDLMNQPWARPHAGSAEAALSGLGSAVQAAIPAAAGHDSSIPRSFFALFDVTVLVVAFAMTKGFAPWVQWLLLPDGPFRLSLPAWLALPESASPENFAALPNLSQRRRAVDRGFPLTEQIEVGSVEDKDALAHATLLETTLFVG